jgi:Flp pilus assembly protein TadD
LLADYWTTEVPIASSLGAPAVLASLALWVGIGLLLFRSVRREHRLVLPLAWFLITMAPVSNVLFPIGVAKAERLMYLPSVGLCILVGWAFVRAEHKTRVIGRETLAALLAVVTWRTVDRNRDWKDSLTIALATLEESPGSLLMNDIAAGEYVKRGEPQKAVPLLQEAARQAPYMAFVHTHLGTTYSMLGMYDQAIDAFREALRLNPSDADARNNLGIAYDLTSREDLAIEEFRAAIAIRPGFADPHMNLGLLHLERGQLSDAVTELSEAARLNPASADVQNNLGLALSRDNQLERAAEHYREALRLNPNHAMARANLERLQVQRRPP